MQFTIRKTELGRGVFAKRLIRKGTVITAMSGTERTWEEVERLIKIGKVRVDDPFQIAEDDFVLLDHVPRLFNHSCEPNAGINRARSLVALRNIRAGEEICYDYSTTVCTHSTWTLRCKCESRVCRKKIGNVLTIPRVLRVRYQRTGVLPRFIVKEMQ